jgi:coproporphyrinogen III oxidase
MTENDAGRDARRQQARQWFGGGADLTPTIPDPDETEAFHAALRAACDAHDPGYYPRFSRVKWP